jgi:hypothetical protein
MVNLKMQNDGCRMDIPIYYFTAFAVHLQEIFCGAGADWGFEQIWDRRFVQLVRGFSLGVDLN